MNTEVEELEQWYQYKLEVRKAEVKRAFDLISKRLAEMGIEQKYKELRENFFKLILDRLAKDGLTRKVHQTGLENGNIYIGEAIEGDLPGSYYGARIDNSLILHLQS
jgi:hypothetical protein